MLSKPLLTALLLIPLTITATNSAETRPNLDEQVLKQRYDAFVEALDDKRIATDYPKAVQKLDSPDPQVQIAGIKTLAATGEVEAVPWIVPFVDSNERHVRIYAGQALNALVASHELKRRDKSQPDRVVILPPGPGDTDLTPMAWVILNMLGKPDDGNTHAFAANMIGYLRLSQFEGELRQLLKSRHPSVTRAARNALEMLGIDQPDAFRHRGPGWVDPVGGLQAKLRADKYLTHRMGMDVLLTVYNVGNQPLAYNVASLQQPQWQVFDARGRVVEPVEVRHAQPQYRWYNCGRGVGTTRLNGDGKVNRDGLLDLGNQFWKLKPGKYTLGCTFIGSPDMPGERPDCAIWSGRIELLPVGFEVVAEVPEGALKVAVEKTREDASAGGKQLWRALAGIVRPGMTLDQLHIVLPPVPETASTEADAKTAKTHRPLFFHRYTLDSKSAVKAICRRGDLEGKLVLMAAPQVISRTSAYAANDESSVTSRIALKVVESSIDAPGVEKQCRGTFVVNNVGSAFQIPPNVVGPSYGVFIYDEQGKLLFRNYGGWGPGMKAGGTIQLSWNTSSNHLGETSEPPFLVPAPGRYRLEIVLTMGLKRDRILDVFNEWFEVPGVAANVETKPESVLHQAEKALRSALSNLGKEVTFEYAEHSNSLMVKYRSRRFMVHGVSKTGAFSEKPHEVEGPDVRGFLLRIHAQDKGTVNQAVVPQTIRQPYWRMDLDITVVPGTGHQLYWALAYGSRTDESLLNRVRAAVKGLGTPVEVKLPPPEPTKRKPDHLNLTLGWIADSDKQGEREYLFVLNGIVAYRTLEGLRNHVKGLPKGSTIRWAPGCCRMGDEPLLSSHDELDRFKSFCESCGVTLDIIPSG